MSSVAESLLCIGYWRTADAGHWSYHNRRPSHWSLYNLPKRDGECLFPCELTLLLRRPRDARHLPPSGTVCRLRHL